MRNNQKGFASMILIGAIIILVAVGGYFAWSRKSNNTNNSKPLPSVISQTDTSNWKTYTNTKYNYEFKYPDNVGVLNEEDSTYAGPPSNPNEEMLLLADKENTFFMEIDNGIVKVIKKSPLSDQILSTFKFTK